MRYTRSTLKLIRLGALYSTTLLFLLLTNPDRLYAALLVVPFCLLFLSIFFTVVELIDFFRSEDAMVVGLVLRRPRLIAAVVAGFPVLLLVLQSVVQLTFWDVLIAAAIFILAYIYISRSAVSFFE